MRSIDEIIADHLSGEQLPEEELYLLEQWEKKGSNKRLYLRLLEMHKDAPLSRKIRLSGKNTFTRIEQRVNNKKRLRYLRIPGYSVAAGLLLVAGLTAFFLNYRTGVHEPSAPVNAAIVPGSPAAILKTADGRILTLSPDVDTIFYANSASTVRNNEKMLIYGPGTVTDKVEYNTLTIPPGAEYNLLLSDGTKVYLNSASDLHYPVAFSGDVREVQLNGEAYFEVAKDASRPFIVRTNDISIQVLGTSFNVKAYPQQEVVATTLETGSVRVVCGETECLMEPGTQFVFHKASKESEYNKVDTEMYTSWKDGYYYFEKMKLEEIMNTLALWYNLNVFYHDPEAKHYEFVGKLKRYDDVTYLLKKFEETKNVTFNISGNNVIIKTK